MSINSISAIPTQSIDYSRALFWLVGLHIFIIAISNYLVQIPVGFFGFITTWGSVTFPFIFLVTDLTVRIFGQQLARRIIFFAMLPALAISYYFSVVFANGQFVGHEHLLDFNLFVFRIVLASFTAYDGDGRAYIFTTIRCDFSKATKDVVRERKVRLSKEEKPGKRYKRAEPLDNSHA